MNVYGHYVRLDLVNGDEPVVVDAGANRGCFLSQVALTVQGKLLAIEPNPDLESMLKRLPGVRTMACGLGSPRGTRRLFVSDNPEASSMHEAYASQGGITREVAIVVKDLEQIFEELGTNRIDLLKLDIEGEEIPVLLDARVEALARIAQITVEFHVFLGGEQELQRVHQVITRLRRLGFLTLNAPRAGGDFSNVLFLNRGLVELSKLSRFFLAVLDPMLCEICSALDRLRWFLHRIKTRTMKVGEF